MKCLYLLTGVVCYIFCMCLLVLIGGCGRNPSKGVQTESTVNVVAEALSKEKDANGFIVYKEVEEKDAWGRPLIITYSEERGSYEQKVTVRSAGWDGLPYTGDDIVANRTIRVPSSKTGLTERVVKGVFRSVREGVK